MNCRKTLFLVSLIVLSQFAFAQKSSSRKNANIGFSANFTDFTKPYFKGSNPDFGYSLMYWGSILKRLDVSVRYNGLFSDYKLSGIGSDYTNEFELGLHPFILNRDHLFNPFLSAGVGVGNYDNKWQPYAPVGAGLQVNFNHDTYLYLQGNYRFSFDKAKINDNLFLSLGVTQSLFSNKEVREVKQTPMPAPAAVTAVAVKDKDGDGVNDELDACPDVAGSKQFNGCPDSDNDGIADKDDKCPLMAGTAKYKGCPVPDSDNDGVNDENDKCPSLAGVSRYNGCPVPDTDNDGVNDEADKCPSLAGTAANQGCPEIKAEIKKRIELAAKQIYFASGNAKLLTSSNKSLNEVAAILKSDANIKIDINGHTDNTGNPATNKTLSENRAKAVYDYLVSKGVEAARLKSNGFGQDQPIAENKTLAGRQKNRRVELQLHYN